ncbi:MAG: hypothetical protein IJ532_01680 [Alphaproteobacteria bacterium]|nr:hypothetical protein [Alphaproteobacteria bacterium]
MSEDMLDFDGNINIHHTIDYYEKVSVAEYDLRMAAQFMTEDEFNKVIKYIKRITKNRFPFRSDKCSRLKKNKFRAKRVYG